MKCPNCGQENRDVAHFCQFCGSPLAPAQAEQDLVPEATVAQVDVEPLPQEQSADALVEVEQPVPEVSEAEATEAAITPEAAMESELVPPAEPAGPGGDQAATPDSAAEDEPVVEAIAKEPPVSEEEQAPEPVGVETEPEPTEVETEPEPAEVETEPEPAETEIQFEPEPVVEEVTIPEPTAKESVPEERAEVEATGTAESLEGEMPVDAEATEMADDQETTVAIEKEIPVYAGQEMAVDTQEEALLSEPLEEDEDQETLVPLEIQEPSTAEYEADMQALADAGLLLWRDEQEPLPDLEAGTVVGGRYRIVETLATESQEVLYRVRDLKRCPQCGSTDISTHEAFCASCGAVLDQKPLATMIERPLERSEDPVEAAVEDQFTEGERAYWVWREIVKHEAEATKVPMNMVIGQKSDTGKVRELDEDSMFVLEMARTCESAQDTVALFVVADGMGGHEGGEIASKIAIQTLSNILIHNVFMPELEDANLSPDEISDWMRRAGEVANDRVYLERQKRQNDMGTTITAALIKDWTLYLAHIGDCRAYRWSEDGLEQLTTDHSVVASMVAAGTAAPEEIYTHPQRSVIYRCVGDQPSVDVDTSVVSVSPGDRLVICCDGLWEMIRNEGIEDVLLGESDPQQACETMVDRANVAGGADNISVIVVQL